MARRRKNAFGKFVKKAFRYVSNETTPILQVALRNGANHIGSQLVEAARTTNQPSDLYRGRLYEIVKNGVVYTGHEIMSLGLQRYGVNLPNPMAAADPAAVPANTVAADAEPNEAVDAEAVDAEAAMELDEPMPSATDSAESK